MSSLPRQEQQEQQQKQQQKPRPRLRRRFSREEDGSNGEEVLSFLERQGSEISELAIVDETIHDEDVKEMERLLIHHHRAINLTTLELPHNGLTAAAGRPLANILQAQHETLSRLSLRENPLTHVGLNAMVDALSTESPPPSRLMSLDLSDCKLGTKGATVVASILRNNRSLQELILSKNDLGTRGLKVLAPDVAAHDRLQRLDISYNNIKARGTTHLVQALKSCDNRNDDERGLRHLDLTCNHIGPLGMQELCKMLLFDQRLESLLCATNDLGSEGAAYLANVLKGNYTLRELDLEGNQIGPDAASMLVEQLAENNRTLECINLAWNELGEHGANELADALKKNESITNIRLDGNMIGSGGAISLAKALDYNLTLSSMTLTNNQIEDAGAFAFASALGKPTCRLQTVEWQENPIEANGLASLARVPQLKRNRQFWLGPLLKDICKGQVQSIDLQDRSVGDEEILLLAEALDELWSPNGCSSSFLSTSSLASMADDPTIPIRSLCISGTHLSSRSLVPLIQVTLPAPSRVIRLYLRNCKMEESCIVETIARCLPLSTSLEVLSLVGCGLVERDANLLAQGLERNMTLRRLNLDQNHIGDNGLKEFLRVIGKHPTLTSLAVSNNGITDVSMEASEGFMGLEELRLDDNSITDRGALDFCRFLMDNGGDDEVVKSKLTWVSLLHNKLSKRGGETIRTFLGEKSVVDY